MGIIERSKTMTNTTLFHKLREELSSLNYYQHKRQERICTLQPILLKDYHEKSNSRKYTELERASFTLEFPEFSDYWKISVLLDEEIVLYDKIIEMTNSAIEDTKTMINKLYIKYCENE